MPITKPSEVSLTWWKKNAPSGAPSDKVIETNLKLIEKFGSDKGAMKALQNAKPGEHAKLAQTFTAPYVPLIEQLRRYRAVLKSDEKFDEFGKAVQLLIDMAKRDLEGIPLLASAFEKEAAPKKDVSQAERDFDKLWKEFVEFEKKVRDLQSKVDNAAGLEAVETVIGRVRFAQQDVKRRLAKAADICKGVESPLLTLDVGNLEKKAGLLMKLTREWDKALARKAVYVNGDDEKKGAAFFLKVAPKAF